MRGLVAILRREVFERRLLLLLALALGLTAVLLPLLPGFRPGGVGVTDLQGGMALGFALLLTMILALFLGGSIVAGDLAERRLGFYFSRPLTGWAIWGGKMAAALVLILDAGLLVLIPAFLLGGNLNLDGIWGIGGVINVSGASLLTTWALALLLLLLTAHAASVIVRARSPWALLDLAALGVVSVLVMATMRRLKLEGVSLQAGLPMREQLGVVAWMELGLLVAVLLSFALAGAFQVVRGRTDLRRAHQTLSQSLWGMLLGACLLFAGVTAWVLAAGPGDLLGVSGVLAAPRAQTGHRWIAFDGPVARRPGYNPSFFYDLDSGRSVHARFGLMSQFHLFGRIDTPVGFSADGRRAVWLEYDGPAFQAPVTAFRMDLDRPGAKPVRTAITFRYPPRSFAVSPDGRRIATYEWEGRLTVASVEDGRLLAAARYNSDSDFPRLVFAGSDRLRIYEIRLADLSPRQMMVVSQGMIFELDLTESTPQPRRIGELPAMTGGIRDWSLSPAGDRIFLRSADTLGLCDGRTGVPLATLGSGRARATFLADGRIAVVEAQPGGGPELRIFPADGRAEPRRLPFPGAWSLIVADQPSPGLLRVVTSRRGAPASVRDLWQVDLERWTVRPLGMRRLAELKLPQLARAPLDLAGKDGVVWFEPWASRERVALRGPAAPAAATPR